MASTSEVLVGLDDIATDIAEQRAILEKAISNAAGASTALAALPSTYSDVVSTVNGYTDTGDEFEIVAKRQLTALTAEFNALKSDADTIAAVTL